MRNARTKIPCVHCKEPEAANELAVLREVIDETIRDLGSEVTAPCSVDDSGALRLLAARAVQRLRAARAAA